MLMQPRPIAVVALLFLTCPLAAPALPAELAESAAARAAPRTRTVRFSGEARAGQVFERPISRHLVFQLVPVTWGWEIRVIRMGRPEHDFATVATPPFRGINDLQIAGWHFRMADNSGPNGVGPANVNAPQEERKFSFVLDEAAFQAAHAALNRTVWPKTRDDQAAADREWQSIPAGSGRLSIESMTLSHLQPGERAAFEWMRFRVVLILPAELDGPMPRHESAAPPDLGGSPRGGRPRT